MLLHAILSTYVLSLCISCADLTTALFEGCVRLFAPRFSASVFTRQPACLDNMLVELRDDAMTPPRETIACIGTLPLQPSLTPKSRARISLPSRVYLLVVFVGGWLLRRWHLSLQLHSSGLRRTRTTTNHTAPRVSSKHFRAFMTDAVLPSWFPCMNDPVLVFFRLKQTAT
jgi:hypothetical protein